ncbi:MAG: translational GTPase TypA [Candidatus Yonathbacteria bacterium]|nr:translational GTPase TypA [Candidatus Yonathbacteria bacterium]NTW47824.1 translational GTPase TypA [Candidatus Yonathbacteria bacterium]
MDIRNIAIIAHVDHGKTTLTDMLLRQNDAIAEGASMDSNTLERERGITIYSKNASLMYQGTKINIVDTPGHADFGSEVERVLRSIDSVLLIVDAQEGPMPQTRFVLKKSLELGLRPIVVINKIDKPAADPARAESLVFDLFVELGADDVQADFPIVYADGRSGIAKIALTDESTTLNPLLDTILAHVPVASSAEKEALPLRFQPFNLGYDNFMGRLAISRIYEGTISVGMTVHVKNSAGETRQGKITKLFIFKGLGKEEAQSAVAGDIVMVAGIPDIDIGETVLSDPSGDILPVISVDEPTIALDFLVNDSPFAGREGKFVTSRQIREYLERELEVNVGLRVSFDRNDAFRVLGRGELHIAILLENMRRAGYEVQVSNPEVITKEENGKTIEPFEEVIVDTPEAYQGTIIERLGMRGFVITHIDAEREGVRLTLEGPTRGILGYRNQFVIDTRGEGILATRFIGFKRFTGEVRKRAVGSMTSMASGKVLGYSLWNLQDRGTLYIGPGAEVYEGMVIGDTSKGEEMFVNPTKGKQLTNVRASGTDEAINLVPPLELSIERGLEVMADDELLEVTPKSVRLRKRYLTENDRTKARKTK